MRILGRTVTGAIVGVLCVAVLAGCTGEAEPYGAVGSTAKVHVEDQVRGLAPGATYTGRETVEALAYWGPKRLTVYVTTFGSSSCPLVPTRWLVKGNTAAVLEASTGDQARACTADLGPMTFLVDAPTGLSKTRPVTVTLRAEPGQKYQRDSRVLLQPRPVLR